MNWKISLGIILASLGLSVLPALFKCYGYPIAIIIGLLIAILGYIVRIVFLVNKKMSERIDTDKIIASIRKNTDKNTFVEKLITIYDKSVKVNKIVKEHVINEIETKINDLEQDINNEVVIDRNENTLIKLYNEHKGNIFILSRNDVCSGFWCTQIGKEILDLNIEFANQKNFFRKKKYIIERVFIQKKEPDKSIKEVIDKHVNSNIDCYKIEENKISSLKFCDAVIFENFAVCETQVSTDLKPAEYKIYFNKSSVTKFKNQFTEIRNKSEKIK